MNFKRAGILAAPTITSVIRSGSNNIVTWSADNANVSGFDLQRSVDSGAYSTLGGAAPAERQFVDTNSSANGLYAYKVRTYRGSRKSDWSTPASYNVTGGGPSSSLLTESDFSIAGSFKFPGGFPDPSNGPYTTGYSYTAPITFRRTGGVDRLISVGQFPQFRMFEVDIPALVAGGDLEGSYNTAPFYKDWGVGGYSNGSGYMIPDAGSNGTRVYGLRWDPTDSRLYFSTGPVYQSSGSWLTQGYCTLNDGTGIASGVGMWSISGVDHKMVKCGLLRIPDSSFIAANCPGKSLAVGFGSGGFSIVEGHSMGPAFFAIAPPDIGTNAHGTALPCKELLSYPWNDSRTPSNPLRARRDPDYAPNFSIPVISATSTSVTISDVHSAYANTDFTGVPITIKSGTGAGQTRTGSGIASGWTIPIDPAWTVTPNSTSVVQWPSGWTWPAAGGVGYFTEQDVIYSSAVWVKNATKEAIVVFVNLATGDQWYGHNPNEPQVESGKHQVWLFDPADFAAVAQGTQTNYLVEPYEVFDFHFPWLSYPLGLNAIGNQQYTFGGADVTPEHDRIYVCCVAGWYLSGWHSGIVALDVAG